MTWTIVSLIAVQAAICGIAMAPVVLLWRAAAAFTVPDSFAGLVVVSVAIVPSYVFFALGVSIISPLAMRLLQWQTPPDTDMRIADMEWPLLRWVRYVASIHVARVIAGSLMRGTPIWTLHLRLNGARLGKRVYINSLSLSDYNLIECGDDVVIGGGVHLAGHTVERGVVKTAGIRLGNNVTIGLECVIDIGVEIGSHAEIGAMSFVPKHTKLKGGVVYAGIPVRPLAHPPISPATRRASRPPAAMRHNPGSAH